MVAFNEASALTYYLFDGDFGAPGDRVLHDKIVTAQKEHRCGECLSPITKGTRYRNHCGIYDGALRTYKFCDACCEAMARTMDCGEEDDETWPMDERSAIRAKNVLTVTAKGAAT
jgi:hypothetical protein